MSKIAILSYGGMAGKGSKLVKTQWSNKNTPTLPIELCRVSKEGKLVLAISKDHGVHNNTYAAIAKSSDLNKVITDFMKAENIGEKQIGVIHLKDEVASERANQYKDLSREIAQWARKNNIAAVVWNGLTKVFKDRINVPFSVPNAVNYIVNMNEAMKKQQYNYLKNIPAGIITPVLDALKEIPQPEAEKKASKVKANHKSKKKV